VLGVGVIVLSAAIGLTFISRSLSGGGLALMLGLLTVVAIAMPFAMYSRGLVTTAEWLVPVGLLLVLVDGEQLWTVTHALSGPTYAGLVCAVAAGVAVVYQRFTRPGRAPVRGHPAHPAHPRAAAATHGCATSSTGRPC